MQDPENRESIFVVWVNSGGCHEDLLIRACSFFPSDIWRPSSSALLPRKNYRIVTGYPAGDVDDLWPRLIAQYMTKYIPGNPNFVVQNMTGASSMIAANYVYSVAKPDALNLGWIDRHFTSINGWAQRSPILLGQVQLHRLTIGKRASALHADGQPIQNHRRRAKVEGAAQMRLRRRHRHGAFTFPDYWKIRLPRNSPLFSAIKAADQSTSQWRRARSVVAP